MDQHTSPAGGAPLYTSHVQSTLEDLAAIDSKIEAEEALIELHTRRRDMYQEMARDTRRDFLASNTSMHAITLQQPPSQTAYLRRYWRIVRSWGERVDRAKKTATPVAPRMAA